MNISRKCSKKWRWEEHSWAYYYACFLNANWL